MNTQQKKKVSIKKTPKKTPWKPTEGEVIWFIYDAGFVGTDVWRNDFMDRYTRDFLGIYRTKKEATQAMRDIKRFVKERNKV